jgi:hypothetical protein
MGGWKVKASDDRLVLLPSQLESLRRSGWQLKHVLPLHVACSLGGGMTTGHVRVPQLAMLLSEMQVSLKFWVYGGQEPADL